MEEEKPELKEVHSQVLQEVVKRVDLAYQAFFRRVKAGEKPGYPRFKGYGRYDSFTYTQSRLFPEAWQTMVIQDRRYQDPS